MEENANFQLHRILPIEVYRSRWRTKNEGDFAGIHIRNVHNHFVPLEIYYEDNILSFLLNFYLELGILSGIQVCHGTKIAFTLK
jgi:hypothetical protein